MKTMGKRILSIILCLCLMIPLLAVCVSAYEVATSGTCGENATFKLTKNDDDYTYTLTISGTGEMYDYESSRDTPWIEVREEITKVIVEDGIATLGKMSLCGFEKLTEVTLPSSLTSIKNSAFLSCSNLTHIDIPSSVTYIGDAFSRCDELTSIVIPDGVTTIEDGTFSQCYSLTEVTIPNSVTEIGIKAFFQCKALTNITIPDSVTKIGMHAFQSCTSLTEIKIPKSLTKLEKEAFSHCSSLAKIEVDNANPRFTTDNGVLIDNENLEVVICPQQNPITSFVVPDGIESIANAAFESSETLEEITLPNTVTYLGWDVFEECKALTTVTFEANSVELNHGVFSFVDNLKVIYVPKGCFENYKEALENIDCSDLVPLIKETNKSANNTQPEDVVADNDTQTTDEPSSVEGGAPIVPIIIIVLVVVVIGVGAVILLKKKK